MSEGLYGQMQMQMYAGGKKESLSNVAEKVAPLRGAKKTLEIPLGCAIVTHGSTFVLLLKKFYVLYIWGRDGKGCVCMEISG